MTKYQKLMHQAIKIAEEDLKGTDALDNADYFTGYIYGIYKGLLREQKEKEQL